MSCCAPRMLVLWSNYVSRPERSQNLWMPRTSPSSGTQCPLPRAETYEPLRYIPSGWSSSRLRMLHMVDAIVAAATQRHHGDY